MIEVVKLPKEEFDLIVKDVHTAVFADTLDVNYFRYDFAMATIHKEKLISYVLCTERSNEVIELSFGGTVPDERGFKSVESFHMFLRELSHEYSHAVFQVRNDNLPMLKLALHMGFIISGVNNNVYGKTFVVFNYNLKEGVENA